MQKVLILTTLVTLLATAQARADFVMSAPSPPEAPSAAVGQPSARPNHLPVRTHGPAVAQGFGRRVPLAFAVRQIVPPSVRVTYGPDVDTSAPVDWTGGAPWDQVLRAAVEPLGLRFIADRGTAELHH